MLEQNTPMTESAEDKPKKKKIQPGSIRLMMAGDLILGRNPDRSLSQLFRKYEALLEAFANMDREERIINYKYLMALIITSHAKKTQDITERKALFDIKNRIFVDLITDRNSRRKMQFKYLISNNFRVIEFCETCVKSNTEQELPKHKWKFCRACKVDRKFFNVLSMQHKFPDGVSTIFLSNDMMHKLPPLRNLQKSKLANQKEETVFGRYHYNVKNLDVFSLKSAKTIVNKLVPELPEEPADAPAEAKAQQSS